MGALRRSVRAAMTVAAAVMAGIIFVPGPAQAAGPRLALGSCSKGSTHVTTLDAATIAVAQTPGRKQIGWRFPTSNDALLVLVDDAPGLPKDQILISMDIDPIQGVTWSKSVEAWGDCKTGRAGVSVASLQPGINVNRDCARLTDANDFRSGCTSAGATITLSRASGATELWFRKPAFLGVWVDAEVMDSTFWYAFGGRSVRFIWRIN